MSDQCLDPTRSWEMEENLKAMESWGSTGDPNIKWNKTNNCIKEELDKRQDWRKQFCGIERIDDRMEVQKAK